MIQALDFVKIARILMMTPKLCWQIGAVLAALSVVFGAFAAHGLKDRLEPSLLANFETAARYQMYAALVLLLLGTRSGASFAGWFLTFGALVFSGSLYILALSGLRWLGAITPIGGALLIVGLVMLIFDWQK